MKVRAREATPRDKLDTPPIADQDVWVAGHVVHVQWCHRIQWERSQVFGAICPLESGLDMQLEWRTHED